MLLQSTAEALGRAKISARRRKGLRRRLARDWRVLAPYAALATQTGLLALAIVLIEGAAETAHPDAQTRPVPELSAVDYRPGISSSSTSKDSAAPPRISGGEPLSP